jgi:pyrroloquinoline quinone biosynthesis protein B
MTVEAIVLGTAQDGGLPQAGCDCSNCRAAHRDPDQRRWVACLALVDHAAHQSWLIDATPDFREQLHLLQQLAPACLLAGIALTHAHIGHYAGLIHLGREAWGTHGLPVHTSPRMATFLRENAPWSQLVALDNIQLLPLTPGQPLQLSPRLSLTPLPVPHRDEFSDTLAFLVHGPRRSLFYCPDIDAWDRWEHDLRRFVTGVDVALLDGTFFDASDLPRRDLTEIRHPLVTDTAQRLAGLHRDVCLIHLNHSNPICHPGPKRDWLEAQGLTVVNRGDRWALD